MDNEQKNYEEHRFGFYREKSTEELEKLFDKFIAELEEDSKTFETTSNPEQRSEAHRDVIYDKESISYLEKLLEERKGAKHR